MSKVARSGFFLVCLAVTVSVTAPLPAATYIVPSDAELIQKADEIVVAAGVAATAERTPSGAIVTRYTLRVIETLKGEVAPGGHLVLTEAGGVVGDVAKIVPGTPEYEPGVRYLVFTSTNADLEPVTFGMALGSFRLVDDGPRRLAIRMAVHGFDQNLEEHVERARDAERFTVWIRDTVAQRGTKADYFADDAHERQVAAEWQVATNAFNRNSYLMQSGGIGFRWKNAQATWVRAGNQPGTNNPGPTAAAIAFAQWNATGTAIGYTDAGEDAGAVGGLKNDDGRNAILFNDPNNEIPDGNGVAGVGGISIATGQYTLDGETFWNTGEGDVVIANQTFSQSCLNGVVTHEMGHTLGFRHSNVPPSGTVCGSTAQCSSAAIMNSGVSCGMNGVLQSYDKAAASAVYGGGGACNPPSIAAQPADQTIQSGATASLSVGFPAGATVKWYRGTVGDRTSQIGSTATVRVGPLTATTKFWAEVANACAAVSSRQVTVTVTTLSQSLAMLGGRFTVQVRYRNQFANPVTEGKLLGRSLFQSSASETAVFTFADPLVVELMVRLSDARPFDNHIHLFLGGLSDVELTVVITDSASGMVKEYRKPASQLVGVIDRNTFLGGSSLLTGVDALTAPVAAQSSLPGEVSVIRLLNSRFEVRVRYRNPFSNPVSTGYLNARSIASSTTTETAVFFFNDNAGSVEWMVRFSDARPFANRIDFFHGGLTDMELTIEVLDTKTGQRREYLKSAFGLAGQVDRDSYQP